MSYILAFIIILFLLFCVRPEGRADEDPDDEYVYGKNNADYFDMDDDEDWSEDGDFDDDDFDDDW